MATNKQGKSGKTSPEYLTIKKHFKDLASHIGVGHNLSVTAAELYSKFLIPSLDCANNSSLTEFERASDIMSTILSAIEFNSSTYTTFFASLVDLGYDMITKTLADTYKEFFPNRESGNKVPYNSARNTQDQSCAVSSTSQLPHPGNKDPEMKSSNVRNVDTDYTGGKSNHFLQNSYSPVCTPSSMQRDNPRPVLSHHTKNVSGLCHSQAAPHAKPNDAQPSYTTAPIGREPPGAEYISAPVSGSAYGYSDIPFSMPQPSSGSGDRTMPQPPSSSSSIGVRTRPTHIGDPLTGQHENNFGPRSATAPRYVDSPVGLRSPVVEKHVSFVMSSPRSVYPDQVDYPTSLDSGVQPRSSSVIHQAVSDNSNSATIPGAQSVERQVHVQHPMYRHALHQNYHKARPLNNDVPLSQCNNLLPSSNHHNRQLYGSQQVGASAPVSGTACVDSNYGSSISKPSGVNGSHIGTTLSHTGHRVKGLQENTPPNSESDGAANYGNVNVNDSLGFSKFHSNSFPGYEGTSSIHSEHFSAPSGVTASDYQSSHSRRAPSDPRSIESFGEGEIECYKLAAANRDKENSDLKDLLEKYRKRVKLQGHTIKALQDKIYNLSMEGQMSRERIFIWKKEIDILVRSHFDDRVCVCKQIMRHHMLLSGVEKKDSVASSHLTFVPVQDTQNDSLYY